VGLKSNVIYNEDCLIGMQRLPNNSVDLIATDPPYFRVKRESWDRQWESSEKFIEWIGDLCNQWRRILKPNGSLYCFASPQMAAMVEVKISDSLNTLNRIRWMKSAGWHNKCRPLDLRSYLSPWEEIIFAEHYGSDNIAKGKAGINPIALSITKQRSSISRMRSTDVDIALGYVRTKDPTRGTELCRRWEEGSSIPNKTDYVRAFVAMGSDQSAAQLGVQYETLLEQYETLRRPFKVSAAVPFTDVWNFPTVQAYKGKHPCEKPLAIMEHIVTTSSNPGAVILDCFIGSGTTAIACLNTGRNYIGFETDLGHYEAAMKRIAKHTEQMLGQTA
jgi:site-specific DNA-methyltransferase (adenine-specific)